MGRWQTTSISESPDGSRCTVPASRRPLNDNPCSRASNAESVRTPESRIDRETVRPRLVDRTDHPSFSRRHRTGPVTMAVNPVPGAVIQTRLPASPSSTVPSPTRSVRTRTRGSLAGGLGLACDPGGATTSTTAAAGSAPAVRHGRAGAREAPSPPEHPPISHPPPTAAPPTRRATCRRETGFGPEDSDDDELGTEPAPRKSVNRTRRTRPVYVPEPGLPNDGWRRPVRTSA